MLRSNAPHDMIADDLDRTPRPGRLRITCARSVAGKVKRISAVDCVAVSSTLVLNVLSQAE
jgi:hypothetical protein